MKSPLATILVVLALLVGGCSGDSTARYERPAFEADQSIPQFTVKTERL